MRFKHSVVLISGLVSFSILIWSVISGAKTAPIHLASLDDGFLSAFINDASQSIGKYFPLILFCGAALIIAYSFVKFPEKKIPGSGEIGIRPKKPISSSSTTMAVTDFKYYTKSDNYSSESLDLDNKIQNKNLNLEINIESDIITEARVFSTFGQQSQAIWMLLSYLSNKEDKFNEVTIELINLIQNETVFIEAADLDKTEIRQQTIILFRLAKLHSKSLSKATKILFNESFFKHKVYKSKSDSSESIEVETEIKSKDFE